MKKIKVGEWIVEVDIDKTKKLYEDIGRYNKNTDKILPEKVKVFFQKLGVNPSQAAELHKCEIMNDKVENYSGFYHLVGKIIEGKDCWGNFEDDMKELNSVKITENVSIGFTNGVLNNNVQEQLVQLEFDVDVK